MGHRDMPSGFRVLLPLLQPDGWGGCGGESEAEAGRRRGSRAGASRGSLGQGPLSSHVPRTSVSSPVGRRAGVSGSHASQCILGTRQPCLLGAPKSVPVWSSWPTLHSCILRPQETWTFPGLSPQGPAWARIRSARARPAARYLRYLPSACLSPPGALLLCAQWGRRRSQG